MNDIFNIRRFGKYLASDAKSCASNYGLSMILISLMGLIIYVGTVIMGLIFNGEWGGPELSFRVFTFVVCLIVFTFTMPVKCYGKITEKKFGTQWLMIPASSLEKSLSMVVMTAIIMPIIICLTYLGVDAIICRLDSTCGTSIAASIHSMLKGFVGISIASTSDLALFPNLAGFVKQISCPWLYVDDIIGMFLVTLTGAIIFHKSKTTKTILSYIAISIILGLVVLPFTTVFFKEFAAVSVTIETPEQMNQLFSGGIFRHAALLDTINDTLVNLILITIIYFRVKTLKH